MNLRIALSNTQEKCGVLTSGGDVSHKENEAGSCCIHVAVALYIAEICLITHVQHIGQHIDIDLIQPV